MLVPQRRPFLAIDPGPTESAYVAYVPHPSVPEACGTIQAFGTVPNELLVAQIRKGFQVDHLAIEMIASYGMAVGAPVFETCVWIGRFVEAWGKDFSYLYRVEIKHHICKSHKATNANIRQALIDRWGGVGGQPVAIGTKKKPGPLYGVSGDVWAALAVAVAFSEGVRSELKVGIQ